MSLSEPKVIEALKNAPPSWLFTPVINKDAYLKKWNEKPLSIHEVLRERSATGFGVLLGKATKTACLDVDRNNLTKEEIENNFQEYFGKSIKELPKSISWTSGKTGRYQIAFEIPENYWDLLSSHKNPPELPEMELRWRDKGGNHLQSVTTRS